MKKLLSFIMFAVAVEIAFAQVPQGINYQAVARSSTGVVLANQLVGLQLSIRSGSPTGTTVYEETQTATTNQFGLFTVVIGSGTVLTGTFAGINWSSGNMYLQVGYDPAGGSNYIPMGATQLQSVPFALYAGSNNNSNSTGFTIKINGVAITDSSLNLAYLGNGYFLTKTNYTVFLGYPYFTSGVPLDSIGNYLGCSFYTSDTASQSTVYVNTGSGSQYNNIGNPTGVIFSIPEPENVGSSNGFPDNHGIYYIPLNATPSSQTGLYSYIYNFIFFSDTWQGGYSGNFYQALPNSPAVTGLNLSFPINVSVARN